MRLAVYDPATGTILRVVTCPDAAAERQAKTGEAWAEVGPEVSDATHQIIDGVPAPLPA